MKKPAHRNLRDETCAPKHMCRNMHTETFALQPPRRKIRAERLRRQTDRPARERSRARQRRREQRPAESSREEQTRQGRTHERTNGRSNGSGPDQGIYPNFCGCGATDEQTSRRKLRHPKLRAGTFLDMGRGSGNPNSRPQTPNWNILGYRERLGCWNMFGYRKG